MLRAFCRGPAAALGRAAAQLSLAAHRVASHPVAALSFAALSFVALAGAALAATPPGATIENTVVVNYRAQGTPVSVSATHRLQTTTGTPATLALFNLAAAGATGTSAVAFNPGVCLAGDGSARPFTRARSSFAPEVSGAGTLTLAPAAQFKGGDAIVVRVVDPDRNQDPSRPDSIEVEVRSQGDRERLRLNETAASSGEFVGIVQSKIGAALAGDCEVSVTAGDRVTLIYADDSQSRSLETSALVDPFGRVFDSQTGQLLNGARVSIVDAQSGLPAAVFGDDGVSTFPSTLVTGSTVTDSGGTVYVLPQGAYRFPLMRPGSYRLHVDAPASYRYPSTVPDASVKGSAESGWALSAASRGDRFELPLGLALQVDIPVDPRLGRIELTKNASRTVAGIGDTVQYQLEARNGEPAAAVAMSLFDQLPAGARYQPGSTLVDGRTAADPQIAANGRDLSFPIGEIAVGATRRVQYVVRFTTGTPLGEAVNRATATGPAFTSNTASASVLIRDDLMMSSGILIGRVVAGCDAENGPGVGGVRIQLEDGRFVLTDASGRYHIEGLRPGTHVAQVDLPSLPKGAAIKRCEHNDRNQRRPHAQLLEVRGGSLLRADFYIDLPAAAAPEPRRPDERGDERASGDAAVKATAKASADPHTDASVKMSADAQADSGTVAKGLTADWLAGAGDDNEIVFPAPGFSPLAPAVGFAIKHRGDLRAELTINGQPVPGFHFEGVTRLSDNRMAVTQWRGVRLADGLNRLSARLIDSQNTVVATLEREVSLAGPPVSFELVPERSQLVADGHSPVILAVRMRDREGRPARRGLIGAVSLTGNFIGAAQVDPARRDPISGARGRPLEYSIGADGLAFITLQPASSSGEAVLNFSVAGESPRWVRAWIEAAKRDWILVGLAEGTWLEKRLADAMDERGGIPGVSMEEPGGRIALYGKGMIKGDLLMTIAYDSRDTRARGALPVTPATGLGGTGTPTANVAVSGSGASAAGTGMNALPGTGGATPVPLGAPAYPSAGAAALAQALKPDEYYLVYADASVPQRDGVSRRKLYLRIERKQFYAMFGDFNAGLTVSELARFDRVVNGVKSEYRGEHVQASGFVAKTGQRAGRDEVLYDGTSGAYRLSQRDIAPGTERIRLQIRAPLPMNEVLEERQLSRFVDYRLDYTSGELILSSFIQPTTGLMNRVIIVAEYETSATAEQDWLAGGRVATRAAGAEVGASLIHDGTLGRGGELVGLDASWQIDGRQRLRLEAARSRRQTQDTAGGEATTREANAVFAEYTLADADTSARIFARHAALGFGLNQQSTQDLGMNRIGLMVRHRITETTAAALEANWSHLFASQTTLTLIEGRYEVRDGNRTQWHLGARYASATGTEDAPQVVGGVQWQPEGSRWTYRGRSELGIAGRDNPAAPDRIVLGADYKLDERTVMFGEQQWLAAAGDSVSLTRVGLRYSPLWGGQWGVGLGQAHSESQGSRDLGQLTYSQRWQILPELSFSVGYLRQSWANVDSLLRRTPEAAQSGAPSLTSAAALDRFQSIVLGLQWVVEQWSNSAQIEFRDGDAVSRKSAGITSFRRLSDGIALAGGASLRESTELGLYSRRIDLRVAGAWRPSGSPWSLLQRIDWIEDVGSAANGLAGPSRRIVSNLHANRFSDQGSQWSFHHGFKWAQDSYDSGLYSGATHYLAGEYRQDLTTVFDLGLHAFGASSLAADVNAWGYGASLGVRLNPDARLVLGYNARGLRDHQFNEAPWHAQGFFVRFTMRFDQDSFRLNSDTVPMR